MLLMRVFASLVVTLVHTWISSQPYKAATSVTPYSRRPIASMGLSADAIIAIFGVIFAFLPLLFSVWRYRHRRQGLPIWTSHSPSPSPAPASAPGSQRQNRQQIGSPDTASVLHPHCLPPGDYCVEMPSYPFLQQTSPMPTQLDRRYKVGSNDSWLLARYSRRTMITEEDQALVIFNDQS